MEAIGWWSWDSTAIRMDSTSTADIRMNNIAFFIPFSVETENRIFNRQDFLVKNQIFIARRQNNHQCNLKNRTDH